MEEDFKNQFRNIIEPSRRILIASSPTASFDAIVSALALRSFFKKIGKDADVVIDGFVPNQSLLFLPEIKSVKNRLENMKKLVLSVDLAKTQLNDINYEMSDGKLHIFLTPKEGWWGKNEISASPSSYLYDLVVTLGVQAIELLGASFQKHSDFFYKVPIVNIDNNLNNNKFGHLNMVDVTALSTSELVYRLLTDYGIELDANLATCLLSGILSATNCFKSSKINPQILQTAGHLIDRGARREEIIANLYRKHTIKSLQLWGRVLSRLKFDARFGITWATLTKDDFLATGSDETYLTEVIDELVLSAPETKIAVLIYEQMTGGVCCVVKTQKNINASKLIRSCEGTSSEHTHEFCLLNKNPFDAEREVIEEIKMNVEDFVN